MELRVRDSKEMKQEEKGIEEETFQQLGSRAHLKLKVAPTSDLAFLGSEGLAHCLMPPIFGPFPMSLLH